MIFTVCVVVQLLLTLFKCFHREIKHSLKRTGLYVSFFLNDRPTGLLNKPVSTKFCSGGSKEWKWRIQGRGGGARDASASQSESLLIYAVLTNIKFSHPF